MANHKPLYRYAGTIKRDWSGMADEAKPLVMEMYNFDQITEQSARNIVIRFLHNSKKWKGETAQEVKKELKKISNSQVD